jgi:formylglycine-generating enzyme required for sulfatase activity
MKNEIRKILGIIALIVLFGRVLMMKNGVDKNKQREKMADEVRMHDQREQNKGRVVMGNEESIKMLREIEESKDSKLNQPITSNQKENIQSTKVEFFETRNELQQKFSNSLNRYQQIHVDPETKLVSALTSSGNIIGISHRVGKIEFTKEGTFYIIPLKWKTDFKGNGPLDKTVILDLNYKNTNNKIINGNINLFVDKDISGGLEPFYFEEILVAKKDLLVNPKENKDLVFVKGGSFIMGCQDSPKSDCYYAEQPAHKVTVEDFWISKYEVTNKEFLEFANSQIKNIVPGDWTKWFSYYNQFKDFVKIEHNDGLFSVPDEILLHPVQNVSMEGAKIFINWKSNKDGINYRLPTEAEWEYAAKGGKKSKNYIFAGGNDLDDVSWYRSNSNKSSQDVGKKKPNELGLFDMTGNMAEWCSDKYSDYYKEGEYKKSIHFDKDGYEYTTYTHRGGDYNDSGEYLRYTFRYGFGNGMTYHVGFRLAATK